MEIRHYRFQRITLDPNGQVRFLLEIREGDDPRRLL